MLMACSMASDLLITMAYFYIPFRLARIYTKRRKILPSPWILLCFASFIALCGVVHLNDVIVFYRAPYRLFVAVKALCAVASVATALVLPAAIRHAMRLKSPTEYQDLIDEKQAELQRRVLAEDSLHRLVRELQAKCKSLESNLTVIDWTRDLHADMTELQNSLRELKNSGEGGERDG